MNVHLAAAERDGWDAVSIEPVGVQAAVADGQRRLAAGGGDGRLRQFYTRMPWLELKRFIIEAAVDPHAAALALGAFDLVRGFAERPLHRLHDLAAEFGIVTAGLGFERHTVGDDVGCLPAIDIADVRGAAVFAFDHQAVPAAASQIGDGQRGDRDGTDATLRGDTRVAGKPLDFNHHPVASRRADCYFFGGPTVP